MHDNESQADYWSSSPGQKWIRFEEELDIVFSAVNDAPSLGDATLANAAGQRVATVFAGELSDVDAGASLAGVAVVGNTADAATEGVWEYSSNGSDWFAIGSVGDDASALALEATARIRFVPVAGFEGAPADLVVRGIDDSYTGGFASTAGGSETRSEDPEVLARARESVHRETVEIRRTILD